MDKRGRTRSPKIFAFPPVAGGVDVCGCMLARPDGLITVASELSGMLSWHPPTNLHPPFPILILQAMVQSAFRKVAVLPGPWS